MDISREEAAAALRLIEDSRRTFRAAIGQRKGYRHLWLWGGVWIGLALLAQYHPAWQQPGWLALDVVGIGGSFLIAWRCNRHVRSGPIDRRFLAALAMVIGFGIVVWPLVLGHGPIGPKTSFTYSGLVAMQCYILAGIWFDNALLGVGLIIAALLLAGYLYFLPIFWWWAGGCGGGGLILSGFYIKHAWK